MQSKTSQLAAKVRAALQKKEEEKQQALLQQKIQLTQNFLQELANFGEESGLLIEHDSNHVLLGIDEKTTDFVIINPGIIEYNNNTITLEDETWTEMGQNFFEVILEKVVSNLIGISFDEDSPEQKLETLEFKDEEVLPEPELQEVNLEPEEKTDRISKTFSANKLSVTEKEDRLMNRGAYTNSIDNRKNVSRTSPGSRVRDLDDPFF